MKSRKKVLEALVLVIMLAAMVGVAKKQSADYTERETVLATKMEGLLYLELPELQKYASYISKNSENEAELIIECFGEAEYSGYYLFYIGEQWSDHKVNWDYFLVSENLDEILYYAIEDGTILPLEEWRMSAYYRDLEETETISMEQYYGKWKVIQYIPLNTATVELLYWQKEHYLGRTVEITEDSYRKSIYYWPYELDEYVFSYDRCEVVDEERESLWITRNAETLRWLHGEYFDSTIRILKFYEEGTDYEGAYCVVTEDNKHLIVSWLGGKYLLERFEEQNKDVRVEDLYGNWKITQLNSYDSAYEGHKKDIELLKHYDVEHLNVTEFYAPDWFGKKVNITAEYLVVEDFVGGGINKIEEKIVNKKAFEMDQGLHDELSILNEELLVYQVTYGENEDIFTIVPIHVDKMLIHVELGWFVIERTPQENPYFFINNQTEVQYEAFIYPLSCNEIWETVTLDIREVNTFENGTLYELELRQIDVEDELDEIAWDRRYLGYFYVTVDKIYRHALWTMDGFTEEQTEYLVQLLRSDEQAFLEECVIVCSEEEIPDEVDENGYHTMVEVDGDRRIFRYYNDYDGGTRPYKRMIWEKGKGLVYYMYGAGAMLMHIELYADEVILENMKNGLEDEALLEYYQEDITGVDALTNGDIGIKYYDRDLNRDGWFDKIVVVSSPLHSGSNGDALQVLINEQGTYREAFYGVFSLFHQWTDETVGDVSILHTETNGYLDIRVVSENEFVLMYDEELERYDCTIKNAR